MNKLKQETGLVLLNKPMRRVDAAAVVREGSTGRVVSVMPVVAVAAKVSMLPRVLAVADTLTLVRESAHDDAVVGSIPAGATGVLTFPTQDEETVMNGPPEALGVPAGVAASEPKEEFEQLPVELAFYRKYTEAMLRRYVRLSMAAGRVPSLLGRELFRGHVSSYRMTNFEDVVVFCFDIEKLLARLGTTQQQLIKRIAIQQYTQGEAASMLRLPIRSCTRMYGRALDALTEMLLEVRMLEPLKSCQGGPGDKNGPFDSF